MARDHSVENADPAADLDAPCCSALPAGRRSGWRLALRPLGLAGAWCQRDLGSTGLQGLSLTLGFSLLSADWTAEEPAPVAFAHATSPHPLPALLFFGLESQPDFSERLTLALNVLKRDLSFQVLPLVLTMPTQH